MPEDEVIQKYNIVVAEDSDLFTEIICNIISQLGHNPIPFSTGQSTINYLKEKGPFGVEGHKTTAMILCDLSMPEGSGKDVIEVRNSLDEFIPFYLISGVANPHDTALMASLKISGYIAKDEISDLEWTIKNILTPKVHLEKPVVVWKVGGSADDFDQDNIDKKDLKEALAQLYSLQLHGVQVVITSGAGREGMAWKKRLVKYGDECEDIVKDHPKNIMKCADRILSFLENLLGRENAVHIDAGTMMRNYTKVDPYVFLHNRANKVVLMAVAPRHLTLCRPDLVSKDEKSYPNIPFDDSDAHTMLLADLFGSEYVGILKRTDQIYKYDIYDCFWKGEDQWIEAQKGNKPLGPISWYEVLRGVTEQNDLVPRIVKGGNDPNDLPRDSSNHLIEDSGLKLFSKNKVKRIGIAHVSPFELYPDGRHVVLRDQLIPSYSQNAWRRSQIYAVHNGTTKASIIK